MFSRILRRTHLYLALFLSPWVLMYAASTFVMNHRDWFRGNPAPPPKWMEESRTRYEGEFPPWAGKDEKAQQILAGLEMDGRSFQAAERDGVLIIQRLHAVEPRRITFNASDRQLTVEKQVFEGAAFLERLHRRRGFQHPFLLEDTWAFTVDLFIAAVIVWALSGLWMWWEMKVTRLWGAAAGIAGIALFAFFLKVL